jgi:hypothetical protein
MLGTNFLARAEDGERGLDGTIELQSTLLETGHAQLNGKLLEWSGTQRLKAPRNDPFLYMHPIFGLVENDRLGAVDHFVGNFFAAMGRQAMHKERVPACGRH